MIRIIKSPPSFGCLGCSNKDVHVVDVETVDAPPILEDRTNYLSCVANHGYLLKYWCPSCKRYYEHRIPPEFVFEFEIEWRYTMSTPLSEFLDKQRSVECMHFSKSERNCTLFEHEYRGLIIRCPYNGKVNCCDVLKKVFSISQP